MAKQATFVPSWGKRIAGMEGLRAVAAVTVLVGHVKTHLTPETGWGALGPAMFILLNGLTLFFALSGFLLFRPFATALLKGDRFPLLGRYAANRALRIFPAYVVILLLVSLVLGLAYVEPQGRSLSETSGTVGYMTNPLLILVNASMLQTFFPFSMKTGLSVAWSLTVELVFYVVMPVLAIAAMTIRRRVNGRHLLILALTPAIVLLVIGIVGKLVREAIFGSLSKELVFFYDWGGNWVAVFSRSFLVHADLFAFGMVAAVLVSAFEVGVLRHDLASRFRLAAFGMAAVTLLGSRFVPDTFEDTAFAVGFGAAIFFVALPSRSGAPGLLARTLELAPIRYVGLISYSLYLWHIPVIWLVYRLGFVAPDTGWGLFLNSLLVLAVSVGFASVTYYLVEKPALRLKRRTDKGGKVTSTGATLNAPTSRPASEDAGRTRAA